jgi:histidine triad (HIT) family protein
VSADCLFCKIGKKEIPAKLVYEDNDLFVFEDINPQSPTHVLICPKKHFASLDEATAADEALIGKMQLRAAQIARDRKLTGGYRTVFNTGAGAGQTVFHLHLHMLGGREFHWPPG